MNNSPYFSFVRLSYDNQTNHNDMKSLLNWRQWALYALFAVGFFAVMLIFGDDERPMNEWIEVRIYLALIATACFYPLNKLTKKWEREGKIKSPTIK